MQTITFLTGICLLAFVPELAAPYLVGWVVGTFTCYLRAKTDPSFLHYK